MDADAVRALGTPAGTRLLAELADRGGTGTGDLLATVTALRARYPAELVAAAVTQARLRDRGRTKFGPDADRMMFTPDGVQQATRSDVAALRASRLAAAGVPRVLDLCCGIGGDLLALARAGAVVHGVDADPAAVAAATANAAALGLADRVTVERADVTEVDPAGWPAAFVDPARRSGGRRLFDPAGWSPPWSYVTALAAAVPCTAAKVAPGIPHELVPAGVEAEWVSVAGEVKEAALWWGPLATAARRATLLPGGDPAGGDLPGGAPGVGAAVTLTGAGLGPPPVGPPGEWLYEPDGAVIRAGLVAEVVAVLPGGRLLDPSIAYVAADARADTPYARCWRVTDVLPFSLKRLRTLLRSRGVGVLTVKKRGSAVDPERLRADLRLSGELAAVVVLTRVAGAPTVLLCEPPGRPTPSTRPGTPPRADPPAARRPAR